MDLKLWGLCRLLDHAACPLNRECCILNRARMRLSRYPNMSSDICPWSSKIPVQEQEQELLRQSPYLAYSSSLVQGRIELTLIGFMRKLLNFRCCLILWLLLGTTVTSTVLLRNDLGRFSVSDVLSICFIWCNDCIISHPFIFHQNISSLGMKINTGCQSQPAHTKGKTVLPLRGFADNEYRWENVFFFGDGLISDQFVGDFNAWLVEKQFRLHL